MADGLGSLQTWCSHGTSGVPRLRCDSDLRLTGHEVRHVVVVITGLAAELVGSECPDVALSITGAVAALRATGVRVWFVQDVTAPIERCCVVRIGIGDSYVGPAMAGVAAVQGLRLIGLRDGNPAISSDLGGVVAKPGHLQLEYLGEVGHCPLRAGVRQQRADPRLPPRAAGQACGPAARLMSPEPVSIRRLRFGAPPIEKLPNQNP